MNTTTEQRHQYKRNRSKRPMLVMTLLGIAAISLAACSSTSPSASSKSTQKAGAGSGTSAAKPGLKIAYFTAGTNLTYFTVANSAAASEAAKLGATFQLFDSAQSVTTQVDQMQSALSQGFNAWIVQANSGPSVCNVVKQAIAKKVLVVTTTNPICNLSAANGDATWLPGTVANIGGETPAWWTEFYQYIAQANPNGGNVAILTGPAINPLTINNNAAANAVFGKNPKFHIVANEATNYTTPQGLSAMQDILQANHNVNIVVSTYSGLTQGIIPAVKAAGLMGKIKIYDAGGATTSQQYIASGELQMSFVLLPGQTAIDAVDAVVNAYNGKSVAHFINPLTPQDPAVPGTLFITKSNVAKFASLGY